MPFGHHGANHPVQDLTTGKVEITSQNHGFAIADERAARGRRGDPPLAVRRHDPGHPAKDRPVFSVQYHPEASPGPHGRALSVRPLPGADAEAPDRSMPKRTDLHSILVVGAGPIVIGQACEFDYSGTQACKALREEGYRVDPGQLQPGHDHDRPGDGRRHLHRAGHAGDRRQDHRARAARRAAADHGRADRAQHRPWRWRATARWSGWASS